jgi:hypothetical protein
MMLIKKINFSEKYLFWKTLSGYKYRHRARVKLEDFSSAKELLTLSDL